MTLDDVADVCVEGKKNKCSEALFTLGEAPELRYEVAAQWLKAHGYSTTVDYLIKASKRALLLGLLPHANPGAIADKEL